MCNPAILAGAQTGLAIGSTYLQHVGQNQAYNANVTAANINYAQRENVLEQDRVQLDQAKSENAFDTAIAGLKAEGRITAAGADLGAAPTSVASALNADMFGLGREASIEDLKDSQQRLQLTNEQAGAQMSRQAQINSKTKSSGLDLALGIGKDIAGGASSYLGMKNKGG